MNAPEQQQIDHWSQTARKDIARKKRLVREGFYKREDLPLQGAHTTMALDYARLARARFLNGDALASVRREFAKAAKCIVKSFTMAYDSGASDYVGDDPKPRSAPHAGYGQVSWSDVGETIAIDGFNYAFMAADFGLGRELAHWYRDSRDGYEMDPDVNRYAHALKYAMLGETERGSALLQQTIDEYTAERPKDSGDINYFTLSLALSGILKSNAAFFNQGLALMLKFHQEVMIPVDDLWDTAGEFICDHAVALSNLAISHGLKVTLEHDLLPPGLLIPAIR